MRLCFLALSSAFLFISASAYAAERYEFDKSHTAILFFINHMGFSDMVGGIKEYDGYFEFDPREPEKSAVDITLKPKSIRTTSDALDQELTGKNFFNTAQFPTIHFVSTSIHITGKDTGELTGNLTLLGVTRPITFHVHFNKADYSPITQDFVAGFSADGTLKRSDFAMNYLIPIVADDVRIHIESEGINIDRKKKLSLRQD